MATRATTSKKVRLQRGDGATPTEVFTTIGEVTNVKGPGEKAPQLDASSFDSDAMEFVSGLVDAGELTFDVNFIGSDAQQQGLRTDMRAGTLRNFKLILSDHATTPTTIAFAAIVTSAPELNFGTNAVIKGSCALKISGQPSWTYAPAP